MKRYRLYTEDMNRLKLVTKFSQYFKFFSLYKLVGYYKGSEEYSLCFEVISNEKYVPQRLRLLAHWIKQFNNQEAVMLTTDLVTADTI